MIYLFIPPPSRRRGPVAFGYQHHWPELRGLIGIRAKNRQRPREGRMNDKEAPEAIDRFGARCTGCKRWISAQTRKEWHRAIRLPCPHCGKQAWTSPDVYCTACAAHPGKPCMTINGEVRAPHAPRYHLARYPDPCPGCGAGFGEPCKKISGATSLYPHRARVRVSARRGRSNE